MVYIIFDFEFFIRFLPSSGPQQVVAQWRLAAPYSSLIFRRNITFFQQTRYKSRITLHYQLYHILSLEGEGGGNAHHRWCSIVSGAWWPLTEVITIQLTIIYKGELRRESTLFCTFLQKSFRFFIQNIFSILKLRDENNQPICKALSKEDGISQYPVWMIQKPWKFLAGACPRTPLEPCGARLGNQSVFILDLHLELSSGRLKGGLGCSILI